jgi:hypothetical protein
MLGAANTALPCQQRCTAWQPTELLRTPGSLELHRSGTLTVPLRLSSLLQARQAAEREASAADQRLGEALRRVQQLEQELDAE